MKRRFWLAGIALVATTAGCGFHPLYSGPGGATIDAAQANIYVAIIPERSGQLLRQALQARLDTGGAGNSKYTLSVGFMLSQEAVGFQSDNSSTRTRVTGNASWSLALSSDPSTVVAHGTARALEGFNSIDGQFFYGDMQVSAAQRRLTETLADDIAEQLAIKLRKA